MGRDAGQAVIGSFDFALASYNSDGTLDASFGTGGIVTTDYGTARFGPSVARVRNVSRSERSTVVVLPQQG